MLILDEATSSVDTETELLIRDALHVLMAGRTTIAIAHRLSTIQDMDKILVLHKGELRERARTRSCWPQRGIYFKLFELQYKAERRNGRRRQLKSPRLTVEARASSCRQRLRAAACGRRRAAPVPGALEEPVDEARRRRASGSSPGAARSGESAAGRTASASLQLHM